MLLRKLKPGQVAKLFRPLNWRGVSPDKDPGRLPEDSPFLRINTRDEGGVPVFRGGQTRRVNVGGMVTGLATQEIGAARSLFITGDGCPGVSAGDGSYLGVIDQESADPTSQTPTSYQNATYYSTADFGIVAVTFGDELFFGLDDELKRFSAADSLQETRLRFPSAYVAVSAAIEHQGVLLLALVGAAASGVGTSAVFTFDGTTLTNVLTGINVVKGFGLYNETAVAIFDGTPNSIRVRSSAGVWSAPIAPSGGTVKIVGSNCDSHRNLLWIPGGDSDLFSFDGTTLTQVTLATTLVDVGAHIMSVAVMADENDIQTLYYLWHTATEDNVYIGSYDGTTWTPKLKDLTGQASWPGFMNQEPAASMPTAFVPGISRVIRQYRGSLVVAAIEEAPGSLAAVYFSPRSDVDGEWTRLIMSIANATSDISDMLVF